MTTDPTHSTPSLDNRSRMLWAGLVLALAVAMGAGAWSAISRLQNAPGRSATRGHDQPQIATGAAGISLSSPAAAGDLPAGDALPSFSLVEKSGRIVRSDDLRGKVWVADFIFTRCPNVCPDLTRKMGEVRRRLDEGGATDIVTVSISVDPVFDTPPVLAKYAENFRANAPSWLFLTGEPDAVVRLVNDGFHLIMNDPKAGPPAHSNRFVLVDRLGRTRGTHLGSDAGVVDQIVKEALTLASEGSDKASTGAGS